MVVQENTLRVETYKTIYNLINNHIADYLSGWTIVSAYPEVNPVFPCIVINPASVAVTKETLNFAVRSSVVTVQIEYYVKASSGKKTLDEVRDAISDMFMTYKDEFGNVNLGILDMDDISSDMFIEGGQKINYGGTVVKFKLWV